MILSNRADNHSRRLYFRPFLEFHGLISQQLVIECTNHDLMQRYGRDDENEKLDNQIRFGIAHHSKRRLVIGSQTKGSKCKVFSP